jgi:hypothetical protein
MQPAALFGLVMVFLLQGVVVKSKLLSFDENKYSEFPRTLK